MNGSTHPTTKIIMKWMKLSENRVNRETKQDNRRTIVIILSLRLSLASTTASVPSVNNHEDSLCYKENEAPAPARNNMLQKKAIQCKQYNRSNSTKMMSVTKIQTPSVAHQNIFPSVNDHEDSLCNKENEAPVPARNNMLQKKATLRKRDNHTNSPM